MFSRFIDVLAAHSFLFTNNIPLLMGIKVVATFWPLWVMLMGIAAYRFWCGHMFSILFGVSLGMELLGYMATMCNILGNSAVGICLQKT